ncbi:ABC-F type ribosomal protection protein [Bacillus sp. ISL-47]|uniref:ribosomal protection-like ABC-F family protein n=1 Tax=Bacillus sp. ISL-47 TaxID=2819130 RepID=UPI001BEC2D1A|nr:ABC-F type ribosomal protection protein [Bacillus sp. ISL-47]MBT2690395.1 ABC-F type ribosomal protection protein [Bacillus sp. ISL-47]MBT2707478.1 ABC-F type ribosomal protection protein [Pseudomonas sp. ISL-84]
MGENKRLNTDKHNRNLHLPVLKARGIEKSYADKTVFSNLQFDIFQRDRIGLVGLNGTGKTTLANILFGSIEADKGSIERMKEPFRIGYLHQSADYSVGEFQEFETILDKDMLYQASKLGLSKIQEWEQERLKSLSDGERLKLSLAKVWTSKPDMLILDEPTNHLDSKGIEWLINQISAFSGPVLMISHDRYFLDETAQQIFELQNGTLSIYDGNYTSYREQKEKNYEDQLHQYNTQQRDIERIENQMANLKKWSEKAHRESTKGGSPSENRQIGFKEYNRVKAKRMDQQIKSKMKRLEQELEKNKIEKPEGEAKVHFQFDASGKRGKRIIEAKNLSKRFGDRVLFKDSHFYIKHGEKIGILGGNGAGKTTFIRMLLNEIPVSEGELWRSDTLKIAYLSQDVSDLPLAKSPVEALNLTDRETIFRARTLLANLGLKEAMINQPIENLSMGERIRINLTDMLLREYDVLILDEPTNHLDLPSREQFEKTLKDFTGTLIIISHDRYFMEKLSSKMLVFENNRIARYEMGLREFGVKSKKATPLENGDNRKEEMMVIENRITAILGELSLLSPGEPKYSELDQKFKELLKEKKELTDL